MFDEFFGVPMHPFAVHAPIVLLPIAAVAAVVFAVRDDLRRRVGWAMTAAVGVLAAMLFVAKESGEAARDAQNVFGDIDEHQDLGTQTFVITLVWFVVTAGSYVLDRRSSPPPTADLSAGAATGTDPVARGIAVLAAVVGIVATIWLIRTGHEGAASRWDIG